jgi:hypothetical protein
MMRKKRFQPNTMFYVATENAALGALIRELPAERRTMWQDRNRLGLPTSSSPES